MISPAGPIDEKRVQHAKANMKGLGLIPVFGNMRKNNTDILQVKMNRDLKIFMKCLRIRTSKQFGLSVVDMAVRESLINLIMI